jgi:hypothetical protein
MKLAETIYTPFLNLHFFPAENSDVMNVWSMNLYPPRYNKQIFCLISNYNM